MLSLSKRSIAVIFNDIKNHKFTIPDYKRPYNWEIKECETMWNDIVENINLPNEYFLGTIVLFKGYNYNFEIIDGQQRIISFFLLLRALYKKLENSDQRQKSIIRLKKQIAPCIWHIDKITHEIKKVSLIHIESKVKTEEKILHKILKTGNYDEYAKDNYSINYGYFVSQIDEYTKNYPMELEKLCLFILRKCFLIPIECECLDTALTIFLNNNEKGLPLSDSDILKVKNYRNKKIRKK
ncbi:hypothetical protein R84B8_01648 [Treponema sp. R8-4-B8]